MRTTPPHRLLPFTNHLRSDSRRWTTTGAALFAALWCCAPSSAVPWYVDRDAPPAGDGMSWATAFQHLQDALAVAANGDEILVAEGTYFPDRTALQPAGSGDRNASFELVDGVALYGGYAGFGQPNPDARDPEVYVTILSGDLDEDDVPDLAAGLACRVTPADPTCKDFDLDMDWDVDCVDLNMCENTYRVVVGFNVGDTTALDGFTILQGNADGTDARRRGPGIYLDSTNAIVTNCVITTTTSSSRGGVHIKGGSPVIMECRVQANATLGSGGGIGIEGGSPLIDACHITDNYAQVSGPGVFCNLGAAARLQGCSITEHMQPADIMSRAIVFNAGGSELVVVDCLLQDNFGGGIEDFGGTSTSIRSIFLNNVSDVGGGIRSAAGSNTTAVNCLFLGNLGASRGGGVGVVGGSQATLVNCLFNANTARNGGATSCQDGTLRVSSTTVVQNQAERQGGGIFVSGGDVDVANSIIWGNQDGTAEAGGPFTDESAQIHIGSVAVIDSIVQGWTGPGSGVLDADPLFADPASMDFRLTPGSPAIDTGNNAAILEDVGDLDCDTDLAEPTPFDLDNALRLAEVQGVPSDCGLEPCADLGAYEFQCAGDTNGDGQVDLSDLALVISNFGASDAKYPDGDLNGDGAVDLSDLAIVIAHFGTICGA